MHCGGGTCRWQYAVFATCCASIADECTGLQSGWEVSAHRADLVSACTNPLSIVRVSGQQALAAAAPRSGLLGAPVMTPDNVDLLCETAHSMYAITYGVAVLARHASRSCNADRPSRMGKVKCSRKVCHPTATEVHATQSHVEPYRYRKCRLAASMVHWPPVNCKAVWHTVTVSCSSKIQGGFDCLSLLSQHSRLQCDRCSCPCPSTHSVAQAVVFCLRQEVMACDTSLLSSTQSQNTCQYQPVCHPIAISGGSLDASESGIKLTSSSTSIISIRDTPARRVIARVCHEPRLAP